MYKKGPSFVLCTGTVEAGSEEGRQGGGDSLRFSRSSTRNEDCRNHGRPVRYRHTLIVNTFALYLYTLGTLSTIRAGGHHPPVGYRLVGSNKMIYTQYCTMSIIKV